VRPRKRPRNRTASYTRVGCGVRKSWAGVDERARESYGASVVVGNGDESAGARVIASS
jgi:hypothetical protein